MRYILAICMSLMLCLVAFFGLAKNTQSAVKAPIMVNLYAQPSLHAKVVATIHPSQFLVRIFQKKGWIKVGNPKNGDVGWLNEKQYKKASTKWMRSVAKPTSYSVTAKDDNGKYTVVAYKDGKKLNPKQAEKLFKQTQNNQESLQESFVRLQENINQSFADSMQMFDNNMASIPMFAPVVFVVHSK